MALVLIINCTSFWNTALKYISIASLLYIKNGHCFKIADYVVGLIVKLRPQEKSEHPTSDLFKLVS